MPYFSYPQSPLSPIHTKNDNYKDNDISGQYCICILSARASVTLNYPARDSRMDSDWVSIILSFISLKKKNSGHDSNDFSLCLYRYSCGMDYGFLELFIYGYLFYFVLGVNGPC